MIEVIKVIALLCTLSTGVGGDDHFDKKSERRTEAQVREHVRRVVSGQLDAQRECQSELLKCVNNKINFDKRTKDKALVDCVVR